MGGSGCWGYSGIRNKIGNAGAKGIANGNLFALTDLDLGGNNIGDAGVQNLAKGNFTALTALNLQQNEDIEENDKLIGVLEKTFSLLNDIRI